MEDKILKAIFVSVIIFVLGLFLVPYVIVEGISISFGRPTATEITIKNITHNISNTIDGVIHGNEYKEKMDKYMEERFGAAIVEKLHIVKYPNRKYYCKLEGIMDEGFYVFYNKNYDMCNDNFSDIISTDPKFQHLYSEWIKKQIGVEDENVELVFAGGKVDFSNIVYLSDDYREIFQNTKMYCQDVRVYNIKDLNYDNSYEYAKYYKKTVTDKVFGLLGMPSSKLATWIHIYSDKNEMGEQYYFRCNTDKFDELIRSKI